MVRVLATFSLSNCIDYSILISFALSKMFFILHILVANIKIVNIFNSFILLEFIGDFSWRVLETLFPVNHFYSAKGRKNDAKN